MAPRPAMGPSQFSFRCATGRFITLVRRLVQKATAIAKLNYFTL